jgi:hypothetical protein
LGGSLKEPKMNSVFFDNFVINSDPSGTVGVQQYALTYLPPPVMIYRRLHRGHHSWPFSLIMKCETGSEAGTLRTYLPRSDLLVFKSGLPRLLVEVNSVSAPRTSLPSDLTRMLLCSAAVVRFANKFLDKYTANRDFVLLAMYIWDNGTTSRYSVYQKPNDRTV